MHKKLESELISLAHQILQMKNKHDVLRLRDKAREVYEKLSVLVFVDNYFLTTPNVTGSKEEFVAEMENVIEKANVVAEIPEPKTLKETQKEEVKVENVEEKLNEVAEVPVPEKVKVEENKIEEEKEDESAQLIEQTINTIKSEAKEIVTKIQEQEPKPSSKEIDRQELAAKEQTTKRKTLEEEMEGSIPADVAADLFEKVEKVEEQKQIKVEEAPELPKPEVKKQPEEKPKEPSKTSLNDRLFKQKLQVGLNDRIAFVKHLFNFSQEEFNRVLSQLNTFETEQDCKDFLNTVVKPEYDWSEKQEYEERLITLIERKFM